MRDAVGLVVDREVAVEAEAVGVLAQQAGAEAVEGADPDAAARHQRLDALPHLAGGLVGEGDGEDVVGPDALVQQVGDAAGDDARLAAAGPGQDQQRAFMCVTASRWAAVRSASRSGVCMLQDRLLAAVRPHGAAAGRASRSDRIYRRRADFAKISRRRSPGRGHAVMEIVGIGTDIVECLRIGRMIEQHGELFLNRVYTAREIRYCQSRKRATEHFAGPLGGQGGGPQGLGTGLAQGLCWTDIEVRSDPNGQAAGAAVRGGQELAEQLWRRRHPAIDLALPGLRHGLRRRGAQQSRA